jgi:hypothetical protein
MKMSAVKISTVDLLPSGNSVNSATRFPHATPGKTPKNTASLVDAVHDRELSAASVPAR